MNLLQRSGRLILYGGLSIFFILLMIEESYAQVEQLANREIEVGIDGFGHHLPYFSANSFESQHPGIDRLVIVIHGTNRNADDYLENVELALANRQHLIPVTAVVAPQFLIEADISSFSLNEGYPYWSVNGWASGSLSRSEDDHPREHRVSSFEMLDSLVMRATEVFPDLDYVIFTGHSAGGRFINRYTASSPIFDQLCENGISSKSIIANANTFVYMSDKRRVQGTTDQFEDFTGNCDGYNDWSFGLDDLFNYPSRLGENDIKDAYERREVVYLLGDQDNDPEDILFSCQGAAQGSNRFERGMIYYNHILDHYGSAIQNLHQLSIVPDVGHDHARMYRSEEGVRALFDQLPKSPCSLVTSTSDVIESNVSFYPNPTSQYLTVEYDGSESGEALVIITNQAGQEVWRKMIRSSLRIDLASFPDGIYFTQVISEKGKDVTKIIVGR